MHKTIICTVCPLSCNVFLELGDNDEIVSLTGNRCPRGKAYAAKEHTAPERTLTTTVKVRGGIHPLLPVRTDQPIPKEMLLEAVQAVSDLEVEGPIRMGQVLIEDFLGTGSNLVASRDL